MVRRTDPKDDDWQHVKDAKKRKQIQDRLAQRARRQRLKQAKFDSGDATTRAARLQRTPPSDADASPDQPDSPNELTVLDPVPDLLLDTSANPIDPILEDWALTTSHPSPPNSNTLDFGLSSNKYLASWKQSALTATLAASVTPIPPSLLGQPNYTFTVFAALFINGEILGIPCATTYASRSPAPKTSHPLPLHPTDLQRLTVHPRWIDRLPFPKMRDTLIKLQGVVDEEELLKDVFTMPSWTIVPGRACWDPGAWVMEKEWAGKWGWLMI